MLQEGAHIVAVLRRKAEGVLQANPLLRFVDEVRHERPEDSSGALRRPDADDLSGRTVVHLQESLPDVLAAVNRLEPSARFRLLLRADRELARKGVQSRVNLLPPGAQVVRQGSPAG